MIYHFNSRCIISRVRIWLIVLGMVLWSSCIIAQKIIGISTQYDDRFDKWVIVTDNSDLEGTIEATWAALGDFTEWQYNIGDQSGIIRIRQKTNSDVWELLGGGEIVEARTIFPGERDRWQMQNGKHRVDAKMYQRNPEQWLIQYKGEEIFFYTYREYDLRDWIVENNASFSIPMQLALTFIPILQVLSL